MKALESLVQRYFILPFTVALSINMYSLKPAAAQEGIDEQQRAACTSPQQCFDFGENAYQENDLSSATKYFQEALNREPDWFNRALFQWNIGITLFERDPDNARRYFEKYAENDLDGLALEARRLQKTYVPPSENEVQTRIALCMLKSGKQRQNAQNYTEAIEYYSKVLLSPYLSRDIRTTIIYDLAVSSDQAGRTEQALDNFKLYLAEKPEAIERSSVELKIDELGKKIADKKAAEQVALPVPETDDTSKGPSPEIQKPSFFQQHRWSSVAAGGAVALGLGTLASHLNANSAYDDLRNRCAGDPMCSPADADAVNGKDQRTLLLGVGSMVTLGAAAVLYYFELPKSTTVDADGIEVEF